MGFCKRCFGGRIYSSSERGWRGGEDGMLGGGYGGAGGGGDGGEVDGEDGFLWCFLVKRGWRRWCSCWKWRRRWRGEWWRKWWKKLVEKMEMVGGGNGRPKGAWWLRLLLELAGNGRWEENNERERRWECMWIYIKVKFIITILPSIQIKETQEWRLASPFNWSPRLGYKSWTRRLKENIRLCLREKDKKAWVIWPELILPISIKCSMERITAFNDESSWWNSRLRKEREKSKISG